MSAILANLPSYQNSLHELLDELLGLQKRILTGSNQEIARTILLGTTQENLASIRNLKNYVVMRREDLRPLQDRLATAGLSSLGRGEPHILTNINRVIDMLSRAILQQPYAEDKATSTIDDQTGHRLLRQRTEKIFGAPPDERMTYIMVTMPTEAASDITIVENLLRAGMNTARINCAHDDEQTWRSMVDNIRLTAKRMDKACRIHMDLAGHKIRTAQVITNVHYRHRHGHKFPRIHLNDWLVLCKSGNRPDVYSDLFNAHVRALMTCSYPDINAQLHRHETIWIDDGKIGAVIKDIRGDAVLLQVKHISPKGAYLKNEKGLNFPETRLALPPLSQKDMQDLPFVSQHADMVGLSFAEQAEDILHLQEQLALHGTRPLPIIAKIETAHAVHNLPDIISHSLAHNIELGIMIARGDLAIELGSVRLAEIQEEILWLCEAAHVPVIWATQVFESLAKKGLAARAEITDAAMAVRAECVMLNKGPYIDQAVSVISEILQRMEAHQFKKMSRLRALHW